MLHEALRVKGTSPCRNNSFLAIGVNGGSAHGGGGGSAHGSRGGSAHGSRGGSTHGSRMGSERSNEHNGGDVHAVSGHPAAGGGLMTQVQEIMGK